MMQKTQTVVLIVLACSLPTVSGAGHPDETSAVTCGDVKRMYKTNGCCHHAEKTLDVQIVPKPHMNLVTGDNPCAGKKPVDGFENTPCIVEDVLVVGEQSGTNVTFGYTGDVDNNNDPIREPYYQKGLCAVNVHWHLGAEHLSVGEYDEHGTSPHFKLGDHMRRLAAGSPTRKGDDMRRLAAGSPMRKGFSCRHYNDYDDKFTTEYAWKYCKGMHVGETYEVHWPSSAIGACGTPWQYQTPFYDGVFCHIEKLDLSEVVSTIGVQAQVFTIVNDEDYYYPDLIRGMIVNGHYGKDMSYYSGSTTGTSRSNTVCSRYAPITWQVDRKCHLISASAFDKMCADMLQQSDDMSDDVHPAGARELVADHLAANDNQR